MTLRSFAFALPALPLRPQVLFGIAALGWLPVVVALSGSVAFYGVAMAVVLGAARDYPHGRIGFCNVVTLGRLALVAVLVGRIGPVPDWAELAIAVAALTSDGIDGFAARRSGLVSRFGARFDMEIDSLLALVLAVLAYDTGKVGAWVLILGLMRYVWIVAGWAFAWLAGPLPERLRRKTVCVIQIATLIAVICPLTPVGAAAGLAGVACALLVWSFGVDAVWRYRRG